MRKKHFNLFFCFSNIVVFFSSHKVSVLGRFHECWMSDMPISTSQILMDKTNSHKFDEMLQLDTFANHTRNRRALNNISISKADTTMHVPLDRKNDIRSDYYTKPELLNAAEIYLNCSTPNVKCGEIICNLARLKSSHDVGKLQLKFLIDNSKLTEIDI